MGEPGAAKTIIIGGIVVGVLMTIGTGADFYISMPICVGLALILAFISEVMLHNKYGEGGIDWGAGKRQREYESYVRNERRERYSNLLALTEEERMEQVQADDLIEQKVKELRDKQIIEVDNKKVVEEMKLMGVPYNQVKIEQTIRKDGSEYNTICRDIYTNKRVTESGEWAVSDCPPRVLQRVYY